MTGTILEVVGKNQSYCVIQGDDGKKYHAHREEFSDKSLLKEGQPVEFKPKALLPVTDVVAIP